MVGSGGSGVAQGSARMDRGNTYWLCKRIRTEQAAARFTDEMTRGGAHIENADGLENRGGPV